MDVCVRQMEQFEPWKVGGREPKVSASNSTESILYWGICSAIIGFTVSLTVLHIACKTWSIKAQRHEDKAIEQQGQQKQTSL